jgi:F-type H+-transporting ATPase subunit b
MNGLIDIKLVLTQILGFLVMVGILGRFAWGPIVAGLEARRKKIADDFAEADRRQKDADGMKARFEAELRGIDALKRQSLQEAIAEGQKVAEEIKAQANLDAQARLQRAEDEVMRQREKEKELVKEKVVALSIRTAEKILRSKLDDPAQRKLAAEFVDEVGSAS